MIAYYDVHGTLIDVYPRNNHDSLYEDRDIAYHASIVSISGVMYDLTTPMGFRELPIPAFQHSWDILNLAYILKIYCGSINDPELIPTAVDKTLTIMQASCMGWRRRDYLQVIRNFYRVGLFDAGDEYESTYRMIYPALFSAPEDESHEKDHLSTKKYFQQKWEKKHRK